MRIRRVACSITVRTWAWVPSSRSAVKKSQARITSAWERRNCRQVGPVRRSGAGEMPLVLRISHTVDAATLTPRQASSPWILRYPHSGFSLASRNQGFDVPAGGRAAGPAALGSGGPAAPDDVAVPAQDCVRGDQQPQSLAPCFRDHAEQGREQRPVRPGHGRAVRLPSLQDGELVAQDQDLCGLPCLLTPGQPQPRGHPRDEKEGEPSAHDR